MTTRVWSKYQQDIFDFIESGEGNAVVEAVAGSGKSTTIVEGMKKARGATIFLAFNKAIADELKRKGVNGKTFHSLTFGPVMQAMRQTDPVLDKVRKVARELFNYRQSMAYGAFAQRLVGLARGMGVGIPGMMEDEHNEWADLAEHHDIRPEGEGVSYYDAIEAARSLFDACLLDPRVDFDDMLYLSVRNNISLPKFDFVFVDEAQDTNPIQREILRKILNPGARLIAVGDPAQAIYGFRGADSEALAVLTREFSAVTLPLSITYRCPTAVVDYARKWVSHIEAREGAPEGVVKHLGTSWNPLEFMAGDLVVCRTTRPLIAAAFRFIRARVPVQVLGRDIGQGLRALVKKMNATDVDVLHDKLTAYMEREVRKAEKEDNESLAASIRDKVGTLLFLIGELVEGQRTIEALDAGIEWLFADKGKAVTLCTAHKSKGLEAKRVFWLNRSECPAQWARKDWQRQQEVNICYVIATRAMEELYLMESE